MARKLKTVVVYRGDTWIRNWSLTRKADGKPVDFTGATARLQVKTDVENEEAVRRTRPKGLGSNGLTRVGQR